ncbi:MAG TPA: hypothetical protein VFM30_01905 [Steroidobacteraceae bacterium]|jgi:hypothetical protein|nr:hypothetical protein [Steroidobacteraceae bacterium]
MNSSSFHNFRGAFSAVVAAAIVGTSGLALDNARPLPKGVVEVGELTPIDVLPQQVAQLPEITVRATRVALASDSGRA